MTGDSGQLSDFIDGLGPGQLVGRQVLGAPALGDIQLSMCYQKGFLEVEVIRARGLQVNVEHNIRMHASNYRFNILNYYFRQDQGQKCYLHRMLRFI